ncbi:rho guanine nucleotide exchange factor 40 isoform X2 [Scleropages formosus]|uniref:Rho guanine nucleotide exchange factor (GEF) 40 n=1 Tax=Scleropages formosus TaxID=113540 RepID=A0A8C9VBK9_SCLFO|nr:rho guanine nucleotide exchange factor 40-like isoform X2 [Scleropages formosus]
MGSEAVEDCVQGALSSLYPPFESTAPPLLSQVFSVLESTYQHDSLRYLLDYFIPAKHLLHRLQQHACAQYLGCLFLHSGWPLCLGEKVVVQLSTLDWRLLRSTDFYLQVVPFSTRCPRLALKCLAPGGRNVQEILVPESQHALVFTPEWLQSVNKERGFMREGAGRLDTCLVSTCDGVVRLPWEEVVYPKFVHHEAGDADSSSAGHDWGSSCDLDSLSWDEEEEEEEEVEAEEEDLPPDGDSADAGGEYVELMELRGGPDGGSDPKRYLEMQGISSRTKTLPLCRRGRAIKLRRGRAWGHGKYDPAGARRPSGSAAPKESPRSASLGRVAGTAGDGLALSSGASSLRSPSEQDQAGGGDTLSPRGSGLSLVGPAPERKPGVGREKDSIGGSSQALGGERGKSESGNCGPLGGEMVDSKIEHVESERTDVHNVPDAGCVMEDVEARSGDATKDQGTCEGLSAGVSGPSPEPSTEPLHHTIPNSGQCSQDIPAPPKDRAEGRVDTKRRESLSPPVGPTKDLPTQRGLETEQSATSTALPAETGPRPAPMLGVNGQLENPQDKVCPVEKETKVAGLRPHRRKRKGKGAKGKAKPAGCVSPGGRDQPSAKTPSKVSRDEDSTKLDSLSQEEQEKDECAPANEKVDSLEDGKTAEDIPSVQSEALPKENGQSHDSVSDGSLPEENSDQSSASPHQAPHLLRLLDPELLESGVIALTGTVDRVGRALVVARVPEDGYSKEELSHVLICYHAITRPWVQEKGLAVLVDSRLSPPTALCLAALRHFQDLVPTGLGCVLVLTDEQQDSSPQRPEGVEVHVVRGTGILQRFVDRLQLPTALDGDFPHSHLDWLAYRLSLERLTERCESALSLLGGALHSLETEPLPQSTKVVSLSVAKHKQLMMDVLADQRLTELQRGGGAWLAGLTSRGTEPALRSQDCRAALAVTSDLYNSVDDALHRLVRVSNQRGRDLETLGKLVALEERLDQCERDIEKVQEQLEGYKDTPLSLSKLSLKQQKFKAFRESTLELHRETHSVLGQLERWAELEWAGREWAGLEAVLERLPPVRERLRDISHCLSDCWTQMDSTQRLLSTLTEASQWCDAVSAATGPPSASPLSSLPPIPPSRFQDARALAMELGGGPLLELWSRTLERYQRTLAQFKTRLLQAPPGAPPVPRPKAASSSSMWDLLGADGELEGEGEGDWGGLQSWGSLASLFRPQNCSTLKIGDERKKDTAAGGGGFLQALLHPAKKSPPEAALPPKPPRKRHPSFDLQALLAPRRGPANSRPGDLPAATSRSAPMSWLGRKALVDPVLSIGVAAALPGDGAAGGATSGAGSVLIRGVEVSSKEVVDHTGSPRQHVLLSRAERETGGERQGTTAQSKICQLWCRLLSSERQYVALLKGVEENYLPPLDCPDAPAHLRGKWDSLFANWSNLCAFHTQHLLPAMEGALTQTLLLQDCFSKFKEEFLQYSHYIRTKPDPDSALVNQAADFFRVKLPILPPLSPLAFPQCLAAPTQRLSQYCEALEELGSLNSAPEAALSTLRHIQRHGEDLRASDLIVGCPVPVAERGELVRQGELLVCSGARRRKAGLRCVFLYRHFLILTKTKTPSLGRTVYSFKHSIKVGEMGLTQCVGEEGVKFEVWVRQASRMRDCLTLQAQSSDERTAWTHDIAQLLWTHAIHNTELCLKESLCMGVSSKLLLDVTGAHSTSDLDSSYSLNDRVHSSCSDSSSVGSHKEGGGSPASGRDPEKSVGQTGPAQNSSPSTAV